MADKKISQFQTDSTITGAEILTGVEGGQNINVSIDQIAQYVIALIGGGSPAYLTTEDGTTLTTEEGVPITI